MSDRASFPLYRIERDNFDGRLVTRLSFAPLGAPCWHLADGLGRVYADDLDGGEFGMITAPAGAILIGGTLALSLDGALLTADEAYRAAREQDRAHSFGLGWSPRQPAEAS